MEELIKRIREFNGERDWDRYHSPKNLSMSVLIESAELAEIFQWLTEEESRNPGEEAVAHASQEVADVLIYLLNLSDKLGIDPVQAAYEKLEINREKYPSELCRGSSLKYHRLKKEAGE